MDEIPARELRNDVSAVLRRVESGEHLRVTIQGRPVADLIPLPMRPRSMRWDAFASALERARADSALADELRDLLPDTTDDVLPR